MTPLLAFAFLALAQDFEVASVKPAAPVKIAPGPGPKPVGSRESTDPQQARFLNYTLKRLLMTAYRLQDARIHGPSWIDDAAYDVTASLPGGASQDQIPVMLQHLLTDRFRLKLRWETRQEKPSSLSAAEAQVSFDGTGKLSFLSFTLSAFAATLTNLMGRPVADETGIQGRYDISLSASMQELAGLKAASSVAPGDASLSIFTAIQQLGLKLEPRPSTAQHLIVESAEKLSAEPRQ